MAVGIHQVDLLPDASKRTPPDDRAMVHTSVRAYRARFRKRKKSVQMRVPTCLVAMSMVDIRKVGVSVRHRLMSVVMSVLGR